MGVELAGGHTAGQQHFFHHARPTLHHGVLGHGPGANASHVMAFHTVLLEYWCDIRRVSGRCFFVGFFCRKSNQAARGLGYVTRQGGSREVCVQGIA